MSSEIISQEEDHALWMKQLDQHPVMQRLKRGKLGRPAEIILKNLLFGPRLLTKQQYDLVRGITCPYQVALALGESLMEVSWPDLPEYATMGIVDGHALFNNVGKFRKYLKTTVMNKLTLSSACTTNNDNHVDPTSVSITIHQQGPSGMTFLPVDAGVVDESFVTIDKVTPDTPAYHAGVRPGDVPVLFQMNERRLPEAKRISYNDFLQMENGGIRPMEFNVRRAIINSSIEDNNNRDTKQPAAATAAALSSINRNGEEGGNNVASSSNLNLVRF